MKLTIIDIRNENLEEVKEYFKQFYKTSIFTWEGLTATIEDLQETMTYLNLKEAVFYIFSGKQMNDIYELTGSNRYQDNLTFVSLEDYYDPIMKLKFRARWFDDIVDNNARREGDYKDDEDEEDGINSIN